MPKSTTSKGIPRKSVKKAKKRNAKKKSKKKKASKGGSVYLSPGPCSVELPNSNPVLPHANEEEATGEQGYF